MGAVTDILSQGTQDPDTRVYHVKFQINDGELQCGVRGEDNDELGEFGALVLAVRGVVHVHVSTYSLMVTKAPLFNWGEISPSIEELLANMVTCQRMLEDVVG